MCPQHNILAAPFLGQKPSFLRGPCVCRPRSKVKRRLLGFVSGESNPGRRTRPGLSCLERGGAFESKVLSDKAARHLVKVAPLDERRENTIFPPSRVVGAGAKSSPRTEKSGFCTNTKGPSERIAARIPRPGVKASLPQSRKVTNVAPPE